MTRLYVVSDCGGVGRTTVAANLAHALAARGERVRLRDEDRQNALAVHFRSLRSAPPVRAQAAASGPLYRPLAANIELALDSALDTAVPLRAGAAARVPGEASGPLEIVDTPVGRELPRGSLDEDDYVLAVIAPEARCYRTLPALLERHAEAGASGLARNFIGLVNAHEPESTLSRDTLRLIEAAFGARLLTSTVFRDAALPEAFAAGLPVADYAPWSQAANAFGQLADTFIAMKIAPHAAA